MPSVDTQSFNKGLFVSSVLCTSFTAVTSIGGTILYIMLYLGSFVALVPGDDEDDVEYWDSHATKNMFTVFVCVEMFASRSWALYECFRVLRTEALGSSTEQRSWALATLWIAVSVSLALDIGTHVFIYTKDSTCAEAMAAEVPKQRTFEALCAQSSHNQMLVHSLHYANAGILLLAAILLTADTVQQSRAMKIHAKGVRDDFLDRIQSIYETTKQE